MVCIPTRKHMIIYSEYLCDAHVHLKHFSNGSKSRRVIFFVNDNLKIGIKLKICKKLKIYTKYHYGMHFFLLIQILILFLLNTLFREKYRYYYSATVFNYFRIKVIRLPKSTILNKFKIIFNFIKLNITAI